ncbi:MAG: hypothetical protein KGI93_08770, partial [Acidobacteriota bacterium]|nr:hypothetical protein [Acidobacteriota bacterium]
MNVITSRLPHGAAAGRFPRLGILNGILGAALAGAGIASYLVVAGTSTAPAAVRTATAQRGVVLSTT